MEVKNMKIVVIHGQNHKGSTYMIAQELADKICKKCDNKAEIKEYFLPKDFDEPCRGCCTCFKNDLTDCPHYTKLEPLAKAVLEADLIITESPVYVYHATGQMMSFLDHFATWWVVHRPRAEMTKKQAVAISTAAGGGMKSTTKDMADSLEMWGISKVYKYGVGVQAISPEEIPQRILKKIHKKTDKLSDAVCKNAGKCKMNRRAKKWFYLMRFAHKHFPPMEPDYSYWENKGWHKNMRPWKGGD